ncbi:MAG: alpha-galactosidase, partial [Theionarchaea archaeon]|nr:alpha-galactosidase [Theionarchaea archaeon]
MLQHTSEVQPGIKIERNFSQQDNRGIRVESRLVNGSDGDVVLNRIELLAVMADEGSALFGNTRGARIYEQDNYSARVRCPGGDDVYYSSSNVWELYDPEEGFALCIGFGSEERWRGRITTEESRGGAIISLKVGFDGGDTVIPCGEEVQLEDVLILGGRDPLALLERYADMVAELRGVDFPDEIPVSWCSWYPYRLGVTEERVLTNAKIASRRHLGRLGLDIIEVDLGWERGKLPNAFEENEQFEHGLGWLAVELDRLGFRLGAWVAPLAISELSDSAGQHPEWLLGGEDGNPLPRGEWYWEPHGKIYALDLTHSGARRWLEDNIRSLSTRGVRYLKTDFLGVAGDAALRHRHDPRIVAGGGSEALRKGLEIMRREIQADHPDALLLNCSGPEMPGTGAFPLLYVCNDTGNTGYVGWAHHRRNYGHNLAGHLFKHRRWGIIQPSCLCVGPPGTLEEARLRATATFLSGGQVDISDDLTTLPEDRWQVLLSCLPPMGIPARPVDLFEPVEGSSLRYDAMTRGEDFDRDQPELEGSRIWYLPVSTEWDEWFLLGVFSYEGDDTRGDVSITNYRIPLAKIGLDPGREYW